MFLFTAKIRKIPMEKPQNKSSQKRATTIIVLNEFTQFLHLLTANDSNKSNHNIWHRVYYISCTIVFNALIWALIILTFWYLIEIDASFEMFIITIPKLISSLQMAFTSFTMYLQRSNLIETINRLQIAVNQREYDVKKN